MLNCTSKSIVKLRSFYRKPLKVHKRYVRMYVHMYVGIGFK